MINFEALLQEVNEKGDGDQHIEVKPNGNGKTFTLELKNPKNFNLKNIIKSSTRGLEFEDSINEKVYIYKSGINWEAAKFRFSSDNQIEYWLEREMSNPEEFYDYLFEECRTSESYYKEEWDSIIGLPDLYDLYEEKISELISDNWKLAYKYQDSDLIDGDLYREIYYRNKNKYEVEVLDVHPPEGQISQKIRKFYKDHTRWDIDSSYSWSDFYNSYKEGKDINEMFDIETLTKSEFLQELLEKEEFYGEEISIGLH